MLCLPMVPTPAEMAWAFPCVLRLFAARAESIIDACGSYAIRSGGPATTACRQKGGDEMKAANMCLRVAVYEPSLPKPAENTKMPPVWFACSERSLPFLSHLTRIEGSQKGTENYGFVFQAYCNERIDTRLPSTPYKCGNLACRPADRLRPLNHSSPGRTISGNHR